MEAREQLLQQFHPFLVKHAATLKQRLPQLEWDDAIAQVRCQFFTLIAEFDPHRGVFLPIYLKRMLPQRLSNFVRDERRRLAREVCYSEIAGEEEEDEKAVESALASDSGQEEWDEAIVRLWLEEELGELSEIHKQIFLLFWDGWTKQEIAAKMGKSPTRIQQLKEEARAFLQQEWEKNFEVED